MWGTVRGGKVSSWIESEGASLLRVPVSWSETHSSASWVGQQPSKQENCKRFAHQSWKQQLYQLVHLKLKLSHKFLDMLPRRDAGNVFTEPRHEFVLTALCCKAARLQGCRAAAAARTEKLQMEAVHHPGWDEQQRDTGSKAGFVESEVLPTAQSAPT